MILTIRHRTTYRYRDTVRLGPHRLMLRPRDSFDLRLLTADLSVTPAASLSWFHDALGNAVATARFGGETDLFEIVSTLRIERFGSTLPDLAGPGETRFPIVYRSEELPELGPFLTHWTPDPDWVVKDFITAPLGAAGGDGILFLDRLNEQIRQRISYARRDEEGTHLPCDTVLSAEGSCRDLAWLFVECARRAGFAARFVSGYLYDAGAEAAGLTGGGATHAWADVYVPGTGWVEYDPTNGLIAGQSLLRVAVARTPEQASPVSGSFLGPAGAARGLEVEVTVTSDTAEAKPDLAPAASPFSARTDAVPEPA